MKTIDKMSRLTGELEKMFRLLNLDLFQGELPTPVITVIPTPKAYAHYVPYDIWDTKDMSRREINIASGTLDRPLENITASLVHEMVHMYNDVIKHVQDTSNKGVYHNKLFKQEAESHGLIVTRTEKYGYSRTEPGEEIIDFLLRHDELREIEMCRANPALKAVSIGTHAGNTGVTKTVTTGKESHHRKYMCPICGNSCRATKDINIICGDCMERMVKV